MIRPRRLFVTSSNEMRSITYELLFPYCIINPELYSNLFSRFNAYFSEIDRIINAEKLIYAM